MYRFFDICLTQITPNIVNILYSRAYLFIYITCGNNNMLIVVFIVQHCSTNISTWYIKSLWELYHLWCGCVFRHIEDINTAGIRYWWYRTANEERNICVALSNCSYATVLIWPDVCRECSFV